MSFSSYEVYGGLKIYELVYEEGKNSGSERELIKNKLKNVDGNKYNSD